MLKTSCMPTFLKMFYKIYKCLNRTSGKLETIDLNTLRREGKPIVKNRSQFKIV